MYNEKYYSNNLASFSQMNNNKLWKRLIVAGHNLLLSGQAGTGKSYVVNGLVQALRSCGKKVVVVCSSGISCFVYGDGVKSSTDHSHYSLQTADMPAEMVVARSTSIPHCVARMKAADTIIWAEAGMSSKRIIISVRKCYTPWNCRGERQKQAIHIQTGHFSWRISTVEISV